MIPKSSVLFLFSLVLALSWLQSLLAKDLGRSVFESQILQGFGQRTEAELVGDIGDLPAHKGGVIVMDEQLELEGQAMGRRAKRGMKAQRVTPDGCLKGWVRRKEDGQCHRVVAVRPQTGPIKDKNGK